MSVYEALAGVYDELTGDVAYERRADYLERLFQKSRLPVRTVLDLACGTGNMTAVLTERGYEYGSSVLDRHNLLFQFLHKALGIPEERTDHEACLMEHAISDESFERWSAYIKGLDL